MQLITVLNLDKLDADFEQAVSGICNYNIK